MGRKRKDKETFDLFTGKARRDEGIGRVKKNNEELMVKGLVVIRDLPLSWRGQMEDIRIMVEKLYYKPTHSGFWGALTKEAIKLGLIGKSGHRVKMKRIDSHARETNELRRL